MPPMPLEGVTVLDCTQVMAGPFCTMLLADMGADVIKVEKPGGDDSRRMGPPFINGESAAFLGINRNKKSIVLDLRNEVDRTVRSGASPDRPTSSPRTSAPARWSGSASAPPSCARSTRSSSASPSPASGRPAPTPAAPATTCSRRACPA